MRMLPFVLGLLTACGGAEKEALWEGKNPGECTDEADNDGDGDFDCNDSDCAGSPNCQPAGDTAEMQIDRDNDGYSEAEGDCDDENPNINPMVVDLVGDSIDQNCDGVDGMDFDGDGEASLASGGVDCNDNLDEINSLAEDIDADGVDQNCDGLDGPDHDGDGFVDINAGGTDCDDNDETSTHFEIDADCDGVVSEEDCDDSDAESTALAVDGDCDGILTADDCNDLDPSSTVVAVDFDCDGVLTETDCDDANPLIGATDEDADGYLDCFDDCDPTSFGIGPIDSDGDGFVACVDDCNDYNPDAYPGAAENEANAALCMLDADGDGYGDDSVEDCVEILMLDTWGDGWNGTSFDFVVNGVVVHTAVLTDGMIAVEYICWEGTADIVLNDTNGYLGEISMELSIQNEEIETIYGYGLNQSMEGTTIYTLNLSDYLPVYPGSDIDDSDPAVH